MRGAIHLFALITALPAALPSLIAQTKDRDQWGKAVDGLQLALYLDAHPSENSLMPAIRIRIRNTGVSAKRIVIGGGCGPVDETDAIELEVTDDRGEKREFHDMAIHQPCGGRLVTYAVALPPGADFSTPLSLEKYGTISPITHAWEFGFASGRDYIIATVLPVDTSGTIFDGGLLDLVPSPSSPSQGAGGEPKSSNTSVPEHLTSNELHVAIPIKR